MTVEAVRPAPCGECDSCRFGAELEKMLAFVDRRFVPDLKAAAKEMGEANWRGDDRRHKAAARRYRQLMDQWQRERGKILTPRVFDAATCAKTLAVAFFWKPDPPEPPEVTARPRDAQDELDRRLEAVARLPRDRCYRCGALTPDDPLFAPALCPSCFGKEFP